jgi:hypothetical protein
MKDSLPNRIGGPYGSRKWVVRKGDARSISGAMTSQPIRLWSNV